MALPTAPVIAGDPIAAPVPADDAPPAYKNPFLWVPSSYLAMGLIYVTVGSVANIMFKNMGMENDKAAFWSSIALSFATTPRGSQIRRSPRSLVCAKPSLSTGIAPAMESNASWEMAILTMSAI